MNSLLQNMSYQSECILSTVPLFYWETGEQKKKILVKVAGNGPGFKPAFF